MHGGNHHPTKLSPSRNMNEPFTLEMVLGSTMHVPHVGIRKHARKK
jgi:hypothetical protein